MSTAMPGVGLIGLGYWGKNLFRVLKDMGALKTACDSNEALLAEWRGREADFPFHADPEALFRDKSISAVAIAAPPAQHYPLARRALLAGKDVFVEKPMALSSREGQELVDLAAKGKRILMAGHILQYHPAVVRLKELIAAGELGKIEYIYSNRLNMGQLRSEENIWWSFAPHDVSVILSILGEMPVRIHAFGSEIIRKGSYDTSLVDLEFPGGVKAHIFVSWLHPFKEQKLVVVGSRSMAVFDDTAEDKLVLYPHKIEWKDGRVPFANKAKYESVPLAAAEPLHAEMAHFLDCVERRVAPKSDGQEGLRVTTVMERAQELLTGGSAGAQGASVHPTAVLDARVTLGAGTKVWHFAHILPDTVVGRDCVLGQNVSAGPRVRIGDRVKIQNNVSVYEGVELEDDVFVGPSAVFTNVINPRAFIERKREFRPTRVRRGATLGANSTIICGVTIGEYALVAAGAVATKDVPAHALVAGVPARAIGWVCVCAATMKFAKGRAHCGECGRNFALKKGAVIALDSAAAPAPASSASRGPASRGAAARGPASRGPAKRGR
jgi:UDP-2-acetamido-3-amino-2,3-dideoxy-glucuronate N-acetyltransferase